MTQHFLLSKDARGLSLAKIFRMTTEESADAFQKIRWADGTPHCPDCGSLTLYFCPRKSGTRRWRCKDCRKDFTLTSGTLFAWHKLPLNMYLAAIAIFVNEVKGKSALALSRDLDVQYKTAFVLTHKLREAMASEVNQNEIGGIDKTVEIDGAYFGGHMRPENLKTDRKDRRLAENQTGKRKCVVVIRERNGRTKTKTFASEEQSLNFIRQNVEKGTTIHADEARAWNNLHAKFDMKRINHSEAYSKDGACTNQAESFFSRLRRAELGHHHHISGVYLDRYAREMAFREDHRHDGNVSQFDRIVRLVCANRPSVDFSGYWQRNQQK